MLELDFKEKSILLDYYVETGTNIVNLIKDNHHANLKLSADKLVEQIIAFTRDKLKEYKVRSLNMKEKNIFDFLDRKQGVDNSNLNASINMLHSRELSSFKLKEDNKTTNQLNNIPDVESRYHEEEDEKPNLLILNNKIMDKIDDNNRNLIYVINEFLTGEKNTLETAYEEIENDKKIYSNIRTAVHNNTLMNSMKNHQSSLYSYMQILDDDKDKINYKENLLHNKFKVFERIESISESFFNYIKLHSSELSEKRSEISEKLVMIKCQIDEYMKLFYEPKQNGMDDTYKTNVKIGSSIDFLISQNAGRSNDSEFKKFYSLYDRKDLYSNISS
jgi:hypothetical protein